MEVAFNGINQLPCRYITQYKTLLDHGMGLNISEAEIEGKNL